MTTTQVELAVTPKPKKGSKENPRNPDPSQDEFWVGDLKEGWSELIEVFHKTNEDAPVDKDGRIRATLRRKVRGFGEPSKPRKPKWMPYSEERFTIKQAEKLITRETNKQRKAWRRYMESKWDQEHGVQQEVQVMHVRLEPGMSKKKLAKLVKEMEDNLAKINGNETEREKRPIYKLEDAPVDEWKIVRTLVYIEREEVK